MLEENDIRWEQRFSNFNKALNKLSEAIDYIKNDFKKKGLSLDDKHAEEVLEEIIKEGLFQRFEYTFEIAWNVLKDYAFYQGNSEIGGSRDAIRFGFSLNLILNGEMWMDMIKSRVNTSHTYNAETANEIYLKIINEYHPLFVDFEKIMKSKISEGKQDIFDKE